MPSIVKLNEKPNLKPFRGWDEHDVINGQFAHVDGTVNKGTPVSILTASGIGSPYATGSGTGTPVLSPVNNLPGTPSYAYSPQWTTPSKVYSAGSGVPVFGMLLTDIRPYDYTNAYSYNDFRVNNMVPSGKACKIVRKGQFLTNNWTGATPTPGLGLYANSGVFVVAPLATAKAAPSFAGTVIRGVDGDGYIEINLETAS